MNKFHKDSNFIFVPIQLVFIFGPIWHKKFTPVAGEQKHANKLKGKKADGVVYAKFKEYFFIVK